MRILVIDDQTEICDIISLILVRNGYEVAKAGSIADASNLIRNNKWDLVITDVMIPHTGGFELVEAIKSMYDIPVIIMSGMNRDVLYTTNTKADSFLAKPFNHNDLLGNIERLVKKPITEKSS